MVSFRDTIAPVLPVDGTAGALAGEGRTVEVRVARNDTSHGW